MFITYIISNTGNVHFSFNALIYLCEMPLISFHILNEMSLTPPLPDISQDYVQNAEPLVKHPKI